MYKSPLAFTLKLSPSSSSPSDNQWSLYYLCSLGFSRRSHNSIHMYVAFSVCFLLRDMNLRPILFFGGGKPYSLF